MSKGKSIKKIQPAKGNQIRPECSTSMDQLRNTENGTLTPKNRGIKCYINKPIQTMCSECGEHTETVYRPVTGQTTYIWAIFLLFTTVICCPLPFFIDQCKDKQLLCIRCLAIKETKKADCCSCLWNSHNYSLSKNTTLYLHFYLW